MQETIPIQYQEVPVNTLMNVHACQHIVIKDLVYKLLFVAAPLLLI